MNNIIKNAIKNDGRADCLNGVITSSALREILCSDTKPDFMLPLVISNLRVKPDLGHDVGKEFKDWSLNLSNAHISFPLRFENCDFVKGISLYQSSLTSFELINCHIGVGRRPTDSREIPCSISAQMAYIKKDFLISSVRDKDEVLSAPSGKMEQVSTCQEGIIDQGIDLQGGYIGGRLIFSDITIGSLMNFTIINMDALNVGSALVFYKVNIFGQLLARDVNIKKHMNLDCCIKCDFDKDMNKRIAINMTNSYIGSRLTIGPQQIVKKKDHRKILGKVILLGVECGGLYLFCVNVRNGEISIEASGIHVHNDLRFNSSNYPSEKEPKEQSNEICSEFYGKIVLYGASIEGDLDFRGAKVCLVEKEDNELKQVKKVEFGLDLNHVVVRRSLIFSSRVKDGGFCDFDISTKVDCTNATVHRLDLYTQSSIKIKTTGFDYKNFSSSRDEKEGENDLWIDKDFDGGSVGRVFFANVLRTNGEDELGKMLLVKAKVGGKNGNQKCRKLFGGFKNIGYWLHEKFILTLFKLSPNQLLFYSFFLWFVGGVIYFIVMCNGYTLKNESGSLCLYGMIGLSFGWSLDKIFPLFRFEFEAIQPISGLKSMVVSIYTIFHGLFGTLLISLYLASIIKGLRPFK